MPHLVSLYNRKRFKLKAHALKYPVEICNNLFKYPVVYKKTELPKDTYFDSSAILLLFIDPSFLAPSEWGINSFWIIYVANLIIYTDRIVHLLIIINDIC
jgi:hypothetical protein